MEENDDPLIKNFFPEVVKELEKRREIYFYTESDLIEWIEKNSFELPRFLEKVASFKPGLPVTEEQCEGLSYSDNTAVVLHDSPFSRLTATVNIGGTTKFILSDDPAARVILKKHPAYYAIAHESWLVSLHEGQAGNGKLIYTMASNGININDRVNEKIPSQNENKLKNIDLLFYSNSSRPPCLFSLDKNKNGELFCSIYQGAMLYFRSKIALRKGHVPYVQETHGGFIISGINLIDPQKSYCSLMVSMEGEVKKRVPFDILKHSPILRDEEENEWLIDASTNTSMQIVEDHCKITQEENSFIIDIFNVGKKKSTKTDPSVWYELKKDGYIDVYTAVPSFDSSCHMGAMGLWPELLFAAYLTGIYFKDKDWRSLDRVYYKLWEIQEKASDPWSPTRNAKKANFCQILFDGLKSIYDSVGRVPGAIIKEELETYKEKNKEKSS
jgi:hypothetical protein